IDGEAGCSASWGWLGKFRGFRLPAPDAWPCTPLARAVPRGGSVRETPRLTRERWRMWIRKRTCDDLPLGELSQRLKRSRCATQASWQLALRTIRLFRLPVCGLQLRESRNTGQHLPQAFDRPQVAAAGSGLR